MLDRLVQGAIVRDRMLVPSAADWVAAGRLLARRARLRGALRPRDHFADMVIVVSAARLMGGILTANRTHFVGWVELARRSGLDVILHDPL